MLKCIIVDDEQFSIDSLIKYIDLTEKIEVAEIYLDPLDALQNTKKFDNIDILFLDENMPNVTGIELAKVFRPLVRKIIFTTSQSVYAFEDNEVNADAFLLKPFTYVKFLTIIHSLFTFEVQTGDHEIVPEKDFFLVKNKDEDLKAVYIPFKDVLYFESLNHYIRIHLTDKRTVTAYLTIKDILNLLYNRSDFVQFHRAYIFSIGQIKYITNETITLNSDVSLPVGDKYKVAFRQFLSNNLIKTERSK